MPLTILTKDRVGNYELMVRKLGEPILLDDKSKGHPTLFVVFEAEGATVEADDLARYGEADA